MNGNKIAQIALSYVGKTETPNNSGFTDKVFEKKMVEVGFAKGQAWCAYFAELVCKEAYAGIKDKVATYNKIFSGSSTTTYKNADIAGLTSKTPVVGSIAIYRYGNGWQGHTAIVTEIVDKTTFKTVEGNTNLNGEREGFVVAKKTRKIGLPYTAKGLNLVGFINPL
jgi:hypothetical protein